MGRAAGSALGTPRPLTWLVADGRVDVGGQRLSAVAPG